MGLQSPSPFICLSPIVFFFLDFMIQLHKISSYDLCLKEIM